MAMNENRAGSLIPVETVERYEITTSEVCEWLQKRISTLISAARDNGGDLEDMPINVVTIGFSKKFAPMMLILPEEAISKKSKKDKKEGIMPIFQNRDSSSNLTLEPPVWAAIKSFLFTPADRKFFVSNSKVRDYLGISASDANRIAALCSPRIVHISKDTKSVVCLIDPIRIFSERVGKQDKSDRNTDGTPRYKVEIDSFVKLNDGNFKYTLFKKPNKKKAKNYGGIDINRIVRESIYSKK